MYRHYYAGFEGVAEIKYEPIMDLISYRLISYHYMQGGLYDDFFKLMARGKYRSIMLDSGAFSAWSNRAFINFDLYIKYCIENGGWIDFFVNLDVIPTDENRDTVTEGFRNYDKFVDKLTRNGIKKDKIIHVFHEGEDPSILEKMISEYNIDYIGISPITVKGVDIDHINKWLDSISHVALRDGAPRAKYHAFGVGATKVLDYFPFYSADSTTWATSANLGYISVPQLCNKDAAPLHLKWDFSELDRYYVGYFDDESRHLFGATQYGSYRVPRWRREEVEEYARDLGFELGQSKLWRTSSSVNPKENEIVLDKRTQNLLEQHYLGNEKVPEGKVWIERVLVPGLRTYQEFRMYVNIMSTNLELYTLDPDGYKALYKGSDV